MTGERSARLRATLVGAIAPLLWATLALLTTYAQPLPAFDLVAMTFAVAFLLVLGKWVVEAARGGTSVASRFAITATRLMRLIMNGSDSTITTPTSTSAAGIPVSEARASSRGPTDAAAMTSARITPTSNSSTMTARR